MKLRTVPKFTDNVPLDPSSGTQYDTSATSLRKQISKLPFKRPQTQVPKQYFGRRT